MKYYELPGKTLVDTGPVALKVATANGDENVLLPLVHPDLEIRFVLNDDQDPVEFTRGNGADVNDLIEVDEAAVPDVSKPKPIQ